MASRVKKVRAGRPCWASEKAQFQVRRGRRKVIDMRRAEEEESWPSETRFDNMYEMCRTAGALRDTL